MQDIDNTCKIRWVTTMPDSQRMWAKNLVNFRFSTIRKQNKTKKGWRSQEKRWKLGEDFWKKFYPKCLDLGKEVSIRPTGDLKINLLELGCYRRLFEKAWGRLQNFLASPSDGRMKWLMTALRLVCAPRVPCGKNAGLPWTVR